MRLFPYRSKPHDVAFEDQAEPVLSYLFTKLWDNESRTFSGGSDGQYTVMARDAGDGSGGIDAEPVLGMDEATEVFSDYFERRQSGESVHAIRPQELDASESSWAIRRTASDSN